MGMIFVPSHDGISHSADEFTSPKPSEQRTDVLLNTLIKLDANFS